MIKPVLLWGLRARSPCKAAEVSQRQCRYPQHVGPCARCQRAQLARWEAQLGQTSSDGSRR